MNYIIDPTDREYVKGLEKKCKEEMAADPSELNKARCMIFDFRISELTVSFVFKISKKKYFTG